MTISRRPTPFLALTLGLVTALAACGGGDRADDEPVPADEAAAPDSEAATQTMLPDTAAESMWRALQAADYQGSWELWPEKGELYPGAEPHGMLLTTYLNGQALQALRGNAGSMPVGAILVKENYMPDSTLAAVTVMMKRQRSYNPDHNGWFFMKRLADGTVEASGRAEGCQNCHMGQADNDYVMTGSLSGG